MMSELPSEYKTITVKNELYDKLENKVNELKDNRPPDADDDITSRGKLIQYLFKHTFEKHHVNLDSLIEFIEEGMLYCKNWPKILDTFFVLMTEYRSTEWICSPDHAKNIGKHQFPVTLRQHMENARQFLFEKIFIIAEEYWEKQETWEWIWMVYSDIKEIKKCNSNLDIKIRVIRQENIKDINTKFFDMGIYTFTPKNLQGATSRNLTGFLNRTESTEAFKKYQVQGAVDEYKTALENFNAIAMSKKIEEDDWIARMIAKYVFVNQMGL